MLTLGGNGLLPPLDSELLTSGDREHGWAHAEGTPVG